MGLESSLAMCAMAVTIARNAMALEKNFVIIGNNGAEPVVEPEIVHVVMEDTENLFVKNVMAPDL